MNSRAAAAAAGRCTAHGRSAAYAPGYPSPSRPLWLALSSTRRRNAGRWWLSLTPCTARVQVTSSSPTRAGVVRTRRRLRPDCPSGGILLDAHRQERTPQPDRPESRGGVRSPSLSELTIPFAFHCQRHRRSGAVSWHSPCTPTGRNYVHATPHLTVCERASASHDPPHVRE